MPESLSECSVHVGLFAWISRHIGELPLYESMQKEFSLLRMTSDIYQTISECATWLQDRNWGKQKRQFQLTSAVKIFKNISKGMICSISHAKTTKVILIVLMSDTLMFQVCLIRQDDGYACCEFVLGLLNHVIPLIQSPGDEHRP